jgi:3-methyladenine DNA glycosylase AlkC
MALPPPVERKGAMRRADVPPAVLQALNDGLDESRTLSEWLVVDQRLLIRAALRSLGERELAAAAGGIADSLADKGITERMKGLGAGLHPLLHTHPRGQTVLAGLANHRSDMVRALAVYALHANPALPLAQRVALTRPFATDPNMAVREGAWDALRPHLAADLLPALALLTPWVTDADPNIRRCAIEATRPRGVWTQSIAALKAEPWLALALLDPMKAEAVPYPARAVGNWLNDASKSQPDWVRDLGARWLAESPVPATRWLVKHATRTLTKRAQG